MMDHVTCLARAQDYDAGALSAAEREAVDAHLGGCPDCRLVYARWPRTAAVPDLSGAVMAALRPARPLAWPAWATTLAGAAALLLVCTAFWHPELSWAKADLRYSDTCALVVKGGSPCCAE